ncbi:hypothetical protein QBC40DRAFT_253771 [Triangularia verruculosa]|uniref:Uncharacterized protein n=1 Tax=Triangularia verruculosa TaxID=2587418 RepID=A0AAN6XHK4_9PEZI|nr:hypothetical protein QBC40DRAFT_253771 [Triangularia verruculosa]
MKIPEGWHQVYVYTRLNIRDIIAELERLRGKDTFCLDEIDDEEWLIVTATPLTDADHQTLNERAFRHLVSQEDLDDPEAHQRLWEKVPPYEFLPYPSEPSGAGQKSSSNGILASLKHLFSWS